MHQLSDGHRARIGTVTVTAAAVEHDVPAFAARIETAGAVPAYAGDSAPCDSLVEPAENCDVLLCEADGPAPSAHHHTPEEAGGTASAAGAGASIVTHVGPFLTPREATARAASRFGGRVAYAAPGEVFGLPGVRGSLPDSPVG